MRGGGDTANRPRRTASPGRAFAGCAGPGRMHLARRCGDLCAVSGGGAGERGGLAHRISGRNPFRARGGRVAGGDDAYRTLRLASYRMYPHARSCRGRGFFARGRLAIVMHNSSTQFADGGSLASAQRSASPQDASTPEALSGSISSAPSNTACAARDRFELSVERRPQTPLGTPQARRAHPPPPPVFQREQKSSSCYFA